MGKTWSTIKFWVSYLQPILHIWMPCNKCQSKVHVGKILLTISITHDQVVDDRCDFVQVWLKHWGSPIEPYNISYNDSFFTYSKPYPNTTKEIYEQTVHMCLMCQLRMVLPFVDGMHWCVQIWDNHNHKWQITPRILLSEPYCFFGGVLFVRRTHFHSSLAIG